MKNYFKNLKWLRWSAAGAFGLMLVLNIMLGLEFKKDNLLPSLTLVELGNKAYADGENYNCRSGSRCTYNNYLYCAVGQTGDTCVCYYCG